MSSLPAYITQDDNPSPTMAITKNEESGPVIVKTSSFNKKKLIQKDLHGNPVADPFLKVKVSSYQKRNHTVVAKHSRKRARQAVMKTPEKKVSFKQMKATKDTCQKSINLAFSLYLSDMKHQIHSIGKNNTK